MSNATKNASVISSAAEHFVQPIKLSFPVIHISTFESGRAEIIIKEAAKAAGKAFVKMPLKVTPNPNEFKRMVSEAKLGLKESKAEFKGLVIFDAFFFDRQRINPENLPALKSSLGELESEGANYIIASKDNLAEEFVYSMELEPMSDSEIFKLIEECSSYITQEELFTQEEKQELANNARGIPYTQQRNVFTLSAFNKFKNTEYLAKVRSEKANILRDVGLDVMQPIEIDNVGGLENVKQFLYERKAGWNKNLPVKGILLAGVPGGGKSLIAKSAASVLGTTLVRLEISKFYDKHLGQTEQQFARALSTIESIAPVVVLIDEIEKVLGGGSDGDHEVSRRLLGRFLTWLQDRPNKIFIVATANKVSALPPELIRAGRWDKSFYIDLPNDLEREKIFSIHLKKYNIPMDSLQATILVNTSVGFTGAEIEQAVVDTLYVAASKDTQANTEMLAAVLNNVVPASKSNGFDSAYMESLKKLGFAPASTKIQDQVVQNTGRQINVE